MRLLQLTCMALIIFSRFGPKTCMLILTADLVSLVKDKSNEYGFMRFWTLSIFSSGRMQGPITYSVFPLSYESNESGFVRIWDRAVLTAYRDSQRDFESNEDNIVDMCTDLKKSMASIKEIVGRLVCSFRFFMCFIKSM